MHTTWTKLPARIGFGVGISCLALCATAAGGNVFVVNPQGQPGGALLQAAIDAAGESDILLVKAGNYDAPEIVLFAKGITLINDSGAPVSLPPILVSSIPPDSSLVIRGFTVKGRVDPIGFTTPALTISWGEGNTWIEDCELLGGASVAGSIVPGPTPGGPAVEAWAYFFGGGNLTIVRSRLEGGAGGFDPATGLASSGGVGADLRSWSAALLDSTIAGGASGAGPSGAPEVAGGPAVRMNDCDAYFHRTSLTGGDLLVAAGGAQSGPGLELGFGAAAFLRGTTIAPGATASTPGTQAPPIVVGPQCFVTPIPIPARSLEVGSPVRTGQTATVAFTGLPGDPCWLLIGRTGGPHMIGALKASFLLAPSQVLGPFFAGVVPASGQLALGFTAPALPPGVLGTRVAIQSAVPTTGTLEGGSTYVQVDASF